MQFLAGGSWLYANFYFGHLPERRKGEGTVLPVCERSSVVERCPSKSDVVGSSPIVRFPLKLYQGTIQKLQ